VVSVVRILMGRNKYQIFSYLTGILGELDDNEQYF